MDQTQQARQAISDAAISLIAALAVANCIGDNDAIGHDDLERLRDFVREAAITIDQIDGFSRTSTTTIFPCIETARSALAKLPQDEEFAYRISRDGVGRCSIDVYRRTARL